MEQLELLVQPSDLELVALDDASQASDEDDQQPAEPPRTRLKLKLTFFDKPLNRLSQRRNRRPLNSW